MKFPNSHILHITDLEGDLHHLQNNLQSLREVNNIDIQIVNGKNGPYLEWDAHISIVYGGDLIDKGEHDRYLLDLFNNTKARRPYGIYLIAGNRELNKVRWPLEVNNSHPMSLIYQELQLGIEDRNLSGVNRAPDLPWVDSGKDVFIQYLAKQFSCEPEDVLDMFISKNTSEQKILYAKWMLANTMGAPLAWEYRRKYLAKMKGSNEDKITDQMIFDDFDEEFSPNGPVALYLKNAVMAMQIDNVGFMHGGIDEQSFKPLLNGEVHNFASFSDLKTGLNNWFSDFINGFYNQLQQTTPEEFIKSAYGKYLVKLKEEVDEMILPRNPNRSTIVTNNFMRNGMKVPESKSARAALTKSGVHILVTGHQPHANIPGFASSYFVTNDNKLRGMQCVVTDTCNNRLNASSAFTLVTFANNRRISYIFRYATDRLGNVLVRTQTPGIGLQGEVYSKFERVLLCNEINNPELIVGSSIPNMPRELFQHLPLTNKLSSEGWEITAYNTQANTFTLCKVGSMSEGFQIASINIPSKVCYELLGMKVPDQLQSSSAINAHLALFNRGSGSSNNTSTDLQDTKKVKLS